MAQLYPSPTENLQILSKERINPASHDDESASESLCDKDRSLQETLVPHEEREFPSHFSDTPLATSNSGTPRTVSPVSSPSGSCDLSIEEDRLLENVKPITSLSESTGTEDVPLPITETTVISSTKGKELPQVLTQTTDSITTATANDVVDELTRLWAENFGTGFKPSKKLQSFPLSKTRKNLLEHKNTSTQSLNLEHTRNLSGSKSSLDSEQSISRRHTAFRLSKLQPSLKTRSTPDVSKLPQRTKSKITSKHGKLDYSHVKSKVRQYKEEIDALSQLPKAFSPSVSNNINSQSVTPPRAANNSRPAPQILSGNNNPIKHESNPNVPKSEDSALHQAMENERHLLFEKHEFDAIDDLMNSLWDKLEIANKEKRHYKDQYELLDRENAKLRCNLQKLTEAYETRTCFNCTKQDGVSCDKSWKNETKSRPSSSTSTSGWITSSASSHKATQNEEIDYDQQSTSYQQLPLLGILSDESSTEKFQDSLNGSFSRINEIDVIATCELSKSIYDDEKKYPLNDDMNVNKNPQITDEEEELIKAATILFGTSIPGDGDISAVTASQDIDKIPVINSINKLECSDLTDKNPIELNNKNESKHSSQAESLRKGYRNITPKREAEMDLNNLVELSLRKNAAIQTGDEKRRAKSKGSQTVWSKMSPDSDVNSTKETRSPSRPRKRAHKRSKAANKNEDLQDLMEFLEVVDMLSGSLATESKSLALAMMKEVQALESSQSQFYSGPKLI